MCSKKSFKVMMLYRLKNINHIFLKVLLTFDDKFSKKPALIKKKKMQSLDLLKQYLKNIIIARK